MLYMIFQSGCEKRDFIYKIDYSYNRDKKLFKKDYLEKYTSSLSLTWSVGNAIDTFNLCNLLILILEEFLYLKYDTDRHI